MEDLKGRANYKLGLGKSLAAILRGRDLASWRWGLD